MICGDWTITDIPETEVDGVVAQFGLDQPISVSKSKQPNGTWTVVASFEPCPPGQPQSTTAAHQS